MIEVEDLTKSYGRFTAVDHVTFTAAPGRVTGFLGSNGAGKSTTMRMIVGLTRPTSGRANVSGRHFADLTDPDARSVSCSTPPPSPPGGPGARSSPSRSARWACPPGTSRRCWPGSA